METAVCKDFNLVNPTPVTIQVLGLFIFNKVDSIVLQGLFRKNGVVIIRGFG